MKGLKSAKRKASRISSSVEFPDKRPDETEVSTPEPEFTPKRPRTTESQLLNDSAGPSNLDKETGPDSSGGQGAELPNADPEVLSRVHRPQGASQMMNEFWPKFCAILDAMMQVKYHRLLEKPCACSTPSAKRLYHCDECLHFEPVCLKCFTDLHRTQPLHWVQFWNGQFFEKQDISSTGTVITVGHDSLGSKCPQGSAPIDFIMTHTNGVHKTKVSFCQCIGQISDHFDLLLGSKILASTVRRPQSGFTFELLEDFHRQTDTSKKSPYDYIKAIRERTSAVFLHDASDIYPQFLRVQRVWRALELLKRSGQAHGIDEHLPFRRPGNVVVPCFACPEPGFNMPEDQWDGLDEQFQYLNSLMIMKDGHFGLQRFAKVDDPDDVSLLAGRGLFPPDAHYNEYVRNVVAYSEEKSTCSKFSAVVLQNKLKFRGSVITGVLAVECMRHVTFISMVDLQKGERYANADYALAYALHRYLPARSLRDAKFFRRIVETYDVACQYQVNLRHRFAINIPYLADLIDFIRLFVPKKHLDGHKDNCKYRFSLNYTDGVGRSHGEGIEQSWGESKQSGGSTRQMNHGHRHDTLTDYHNYWNWCKTRSLALSLAEQLEKGVKKRNEVHNYFKGLCLLRGVERVNEWMMESRDPCFKDGEWQSVYRLVESKLPSQEEAFQSLEAQEKEALKSSLIESMSPSSRAMTLTRWINSGIRIQQKQCDLKHAIISKELADDQVKGRRKSLADEIQRWKKSRIRVLPQMEDVGSVDPNGEVEDENLFLPSDLNHTQRTELHLEDATVAEMQLREGEVNDAVQGLCNSILHGMVLRGAKDEQARGIYQNTRAQDVVNGAKERKTTSARRYRWARDHLLMLHGKASLDEFPELKQEHMYAKNATAARELGDGTTTDSWIWTFGRLRGLDPMQKTEFVKAGNTSGNIRLLSYDAVQISDNSLVEKVQWFRAFADTMRWIEEVELLEEECRRIVRGFNKMADVWSALANQNPPVFDAARTPSSIDDDMANFWHTPSPTAITRRALSLQSRNSYTEISGDTRAAYQAYAHQNVAMYQRLAAEADVLCSKYSELPGEGETLSDMLHRRRPRVLPDWEKESANMEEVAA